MEDCVAFGSAISIIFFAMLSACCTQILFALPLVSSISWVGLIAAILNMCE